MKEHHMTLLELSRERDNLLSELIKLQNHIRKLKKQAKRLEIEIVWEQEVTQ